MNLEAQARLLLAQQDNAIRNALIIERHESGMPIREICEAMALNYWVVAGVIQRHERKLYADNLRKRGLEQCSKPRTANNRVSVQLMTTGRTPCRSAKSA